MTGNNRKWREQIWTQRRQEKRVKSSGEERKCQRNKDHDKVSQHNKEKAILFVFCLLPLHFSSIQLFFFLFSFPFSFLHSVHVHYLQHPYNKSLASKPSSRIWKGISAIPTYVFLWFNKSFKIGLNLVREMTRDNRYQRSSDHFPEDWIHDL